MNGKLRNTIRRNGPALVLLAGIIAVWEFVCLMELVPAYMLPAPTDILLALVKDLPELGTHTYVTLAEAACGLAAGVALGFVCAVGMDAFRWLYRALYPILVITQTIPTVAIAPLLVLWFGYEMAPKIILIVLVTFFPMAVGLLEGFRSVDPDSVALLRSMGASRYQIFRYIKCPAALPQFFAGLRIAAAYSVVGAVISEWLGGFQGLGVYMTRVRKAYAFDKMFAVILLISVISLLLMALVDMLQKKCMPYARTKEEENIT